MKTDRPNKKKMDPYTINLKKYIPIHNYCITHENTITQKKEMDIIKAELISLKTLIAKLSQNRRNIPTKIIMTYLNIVFI